MKSPLAYYKSNLTKANKTMKIVKTKKAFNWSTSRMILSFLHAESSKKDLQIYRP